MKNNIFGIDLTVFSGDISIEDAINSFGDQFEPWVSGVKEALSKGSEVAVLMMTDNKCSSHFIREWLYFPDENGKYEFFVLENDYIDESGEVQIGDEYRWSRFGENGIESKFFYIFVAEYEYRILQNCDMFK
jgi:hypothetical protein